MTGGPVYDPNSGATVRLSLSPQALYTEVFK